MHQLQPLRRHFDVQTCHAGHVAAGSVKAGHKPKLNRVGPYPKTIGISPVAAFAANTAGCWR
jgi:hypothetical protein